MGSPLIFVQVPENHPLRAGRCPVFSDCSPAASPPRPAERRPDASPPGWPFDDLMDRSADLLLGHRGVDVAVPNDGPRRLMTSSSLNERISSASSGK